MTVTALLLIAAAAAVAAVHPTGPSEPRDRGASQQRAGGTADGAAVPVSAALSFDGVVLERHVVGVTVAYPRVRVSGTRGRSAAEVELTTFNCLSDQAPPDPAAAGCTRSVTEYAELSEPELSVRSDRDGLRVSGAFATWRRPNGSPPVATGRVYELTISAAPRDGRGCAGREPATGLLELGEERARVRDDGTSEISYRG
jgi:hypothetical protein